MYNVWKKSLKYLTLETWKYPPYSWALQTNSTGRLLATQPGICLPTGGWTAVLALSRRRTFHAKLSPSVSADKNWLMILIGKLFVHQVTTDRHFYLHHQSAVQNKSTRVWNCCPTFSSSQVNEALWMMNMSKYRF